MMKKRNLAGERLHYRAVVERIRATCGIQVSASEPRRNNKVGYERRRPEPTPRSSILLPWSDLWASKREIVTQAVSISRLDSHRGSRLFKPPNAAQMRFYRPEGGRTGPAEISETVAEFLNEDLENLRRIPTAFNPNETRDMSTMIANATATIS